MFSVLSMNYASCYSFVGVRQLLLHNINSLSLLGAFSSLRKVVRPFSLFDKTRNLVYNKTQVSCRVSNKAVYDIKTDVAKDVVLYRNNTGASEQKVLLAFSVCQFGFWMYLAQFAFTSLRDVPVENPNSDLPFWRKINFGEKKYRYGFTIISATIGVTILAATAGFISKSVQRLILLKGGKRLTFVTRGILGAEKRFTTDISNVSCLSSRIVAKVHIPIKVKNHYMNYALDIKGEFTNPQLFDYTAGIKRNV